MLIKINIGYVIIQDKKAIGLTLLTRNVRMLLVVLAPSTYLRDMILNLKRKLKAIKRKNNVKQTALRDYLFRKQLGGIEISNEILVHSN